MPFTLRDEVRLEIGDTNVSAPLFSDAELDLLLERNGDSVLLAAAHACDILATRYAPEFDFDALDEKSFKKSQKSRAYAARADALRARATSSAGLSTVSVRRADGYSDRAARLGVSGCLDDEDAC